MGIFKTLGNSTVGFGAGGFTGQGIGALQGAGVNILPNNNSSAPSIKNGADFLSPVQQLRDAPRGEFEQMLMNQARGTGLTDQQRISLNDRLGGIGVSSQQTANQGISQLAQTGGVSQGARERLMGQNNINAMMQRQGARRDAEVNSLNRRDQLQSMFSNIEGQERQADVGALNERDMLIAKLNAAQSLGQAQMDMANKPDMLSRLSFGVF